MEARNFLKAQKRIIFSVCQATYGGFDSYLDMTIPELLEWQQELDQLQEEAKNP